MNKKKYHQVRSLALNYGVKPSNLLFAGLVAVSIFASVPSIIKHQTKVSVVKAEIQKKEAQLEKLIRQAKYERRQSQVANQRYKSCLPVVGSHWENGTHYFIGLRVGDMPKDRISKLTFPPGTVVCDAHGNTAVIDRKGIATFFAFTGDRDVVQSRLSRFRGSQYSQPIVEKKQ